MNSVYLNFLIINETLNYSDSFRKEIRNLYIIFHFYNVIHRTDLPLHWVSPVKVAIFQQQLNPSLLWCLNFLAHFVSKWKKCLQADNLCFYTYNRWKGRTMKGCSKSKTHREHFACIWYLPGDLSVKCNKPNMSIFYFYNLWG